MQVKDLAERLVHSEVAQSVPAVMVVNIKPKEQRQDQDQGLRYYEQVKVSYNWQLRNSHRPRDNSWVRPHGWSCLV